jgi:hypothetical protein
MARIVLCSYVIRYPLGGVLSSNLQYLTGFARLGHDVWLVEKAGYPCSCFDPVRYENSEDCSYGMAVVDDLLRRHGLADRWCYVSSDDRYHGLTRDAVEEIVGGSDLFLDRGLHGTWDEETAHGPMRVLVDPDPGYRQIKMEAAHRRGEPDPNYDAFYTYGANVGTDRSPSPTAGLAWQHLFHPVDTTLHPFTQPPESGAFSTVMNWTSLPPVTFEGVEYGMKDAEFPKFEHLPELVDTPLELAVEGHDVPTARMRAQGWHLRSALDVTSTLESFTDYVDASLGEFSVVKEVYAALDVAWFSDRSAVYLARGRPVVVQGNRVGEHLPVGEGLFEVETADEAAVAIEEVARDPGRHSRAARRIAEEHLDTDVVLGRFLKELGLPEHG